MEVQLLTLAFLHHFCLAVSALSEDLERATRVLEGTAEIKGWVNYTRAGSHVMCPLKKVGAEK